MSGALKIAKFFISRALSSGERVAVHLRGDGLIDIVVNRGRKMADLADDELGSNMVRATHRFKLEPPKGTKLPPGFTAVDDPRAMSAGVEKWRIMSEDLEELGTLQMVRGNPAGLEIDLSAVGRRKFSNAGRVDKSFQGLEKAKANHLSKMGMGLGKVALDETTSAEVKKMMMQHAVMSLPF